MHKHPIVSLVKSFILRLGDSKVRLKTVWFIGKFRNMFCWAHFFMHFSLLGAPILALTATADLDSRARVKKQLQLEGAMTITASHVICF